jgi:anti-anti-sigma factor
VLPSTDNQLPPSASALTTSRARVELYSEGGRRATYSRRRSRRTAGSRHGRRLFTGEHDLATRDEVNELLTSLIDANELVVADLSDAKFVDCSILRVLTNVNNDAQASGRSFRLQLGTADIVRRLFEVSDMFAILDIVPTREAALKDRG